MEALYDPFDEQSRANPYPHYAALRERAPVYWAERPGAWVVSRYDDVMHVLKHPDLFSSDAMRTMLMSPMAAGNDDPRLMEQMVVLAAALPFELDELIRVRNLLSIDPPHHERLRRIVSQGFTSRGIAAWEPRIRQIVEQALGDMRDKGTFDLIADLAIPLPVIIISEMLGVEPERRAAFKHWSDVLIAASSGSKKGLGLVESGFVDCFREFCTYFAEIAERRKGEPKEDLISVLVRAQEHDEALKPIDAVMFALLLLVAGNETTTNLIGNAVNALLDHPEQLELIRNHRSLVPALIEETLRYDGPVQYVFRRALQDVEIAGTTIPENAIVMPLIGSANRDESQFDRPDVFDVTRNPQGHVAFGFGIHFCLGAALARLEAKLALDPLIEDLSCLERTEPKIEYVDSFLLRGPRRLELRKAV